MDPRSWSEGTFEFCGNILQVYASAFPGLRSAWRFLPAGARISLGTRIWQTAVKVLKRWPTTPEIRYFVTTVEAWFQTAVVELAALENLPDSFTRCVDTWTPRLEYVVSPTGAVTGTIKERRGTGAIWSTEWLVFTTEPT